MAGKRKQFAAAGGGGGGRGVKQQSKRARLAASTAAAGADPSAAGHKERRRHRRAEDREARKADARARKTAQARVQKGAASHSHAPTRRAIEESQAARHSFAQAVAQSRGAWREVTPDEKDDDAGSSTEADGNTAGTAAADGQAGEEDPMAVLVLHH